jgi:hypothetical protein
VKFERMGQWFELSDCGRYSVSGAKADQLFTFQAWRRATTKDHMATCLGTFRDAQAARDCCEQHATRA